MLVVLSCGKSIKKSTSCFVETAICSAVVVDDNGMAVMLVFSLQSAPVKPDEQKHRRSVVQT